MGKSGAFQALYMGSNPVIRTEKHGRVVVSSTGSSPEMTWFNSTPCPIVCSSIGRALVFGTIGYRFKSCQTLILSLGGIGIHSRLKIDASLASRFKSESEQLCL